MSKHVERTAICLAFALLAGCQAGAGNPAAAQGKSARLRVAENGVCLDTNNGLMWQIEVSRAFSTWPQAHQYAAELNFAGYSDWRLPTYPELQILQQTIDQKGQGDCPIKGQVSLWSGTSSAQARVGFWDSEPLCGGPTYFFIKRSFGAVRAVRSSTAPP